MSEGNTALAQGAVKELKEKDCKLNLTDLINEILSIFFSKQYEKSKKTLEKRFFDRKRYLKKLIHTESGEVLDASLKSFVKKLPSQSKKAVPTDET